MFNRKTLHTLIAIISALVLAVPFTWAVFYCGLIAYEIHKHAGHQAFAKHGIARITPAMEMKELFADCRHFVTYGASDVPLFNSVAYFGDRYELTMQVPVEIRSRSSGKMTGEPQFLLQEVHSVSPSGRVITSFSRSVTFGTAEWRKVCESGGDFNAIGFKVDPTAVPNFKRYAAAGRPSN